MFRGDGNSVFGQFHPSILVLVPLPHLKCFFLFKVFHLKFFPPYSLPMHPTPQALYHFHLPQNLILRWEPVDSDRTTAGLS